GEAGRQYLDGYVALQARIARAVDFAHAAAADQLHNLEVAEPGAWTESLDCRYRRAFQERIDLLRKQRLHFGAQAGVGGAGMRQEPGALLRRKRDRRLIKLLDLFPALSLHEPAFPASAHVSARPGPCSNRELRCSGGHEIGRA